ncbi:succinylglutamate-semialdehyde dehydrogenase [Photobacterium phosphoreum]|jgi:succinylglutamic semialdehyde dehydrogenase|uniref:succinylglutamate-semialdehyde dehydrogenase n=1 Tax=Photobacterium phosphoreum TaxID=659 RepID=UPI000D182554|nr:succinylglutamate-semialdehyde dehydrogenase [Photobacterium phosphoreum]MCD9479801.1 succinylglutamate-semialdehyde dehydrogenase [Photobacterium phosphoreum]MCD9483806.1 succinylglutamate-semialdehyde dehydrogenase [Photobacterium phosphoreum]MCD9502737.1 succinylglutamate-semialdehyde dehydrogenase [Photobacterium phosphoreum]MCD9511267.1 succinylglutamate-semialdehyde dehydrogenase [Photobacterium phosphoreum]PSU39549.1 succinylglutamate-semialdehyde dehydrogenase [Photobacterium phosph
MSLWINNHWVAGDGEPFQSLNPYDGDVVWQGNAATTAQVEAAVTAASRAFLDWRNTTLTERLAVIERFAQLVQQHQSQLAHIIATETGKPLWESTTEVAAMIGKVALSLNAYHERTGIRQRQQADTTMIVRHRPLGVMAVFGPYNFPAHLPNGHIIPALLAGNTIVFKPSEQTPNTAQRMCELWQQAGIADGVINLLQGGRTTGAALAMAAGVDGVLFTGSAQTGHLLHQQFAGQPQKMLALEMGGNNPLVVGQEYGAMDAAVYTIIQSAFLSAGQRCTCARRLYIATGEAGDLLLARLVAVASHLLVGDPLAIPAPFMGSLISNAAADQIMLHQQQLLEAGGVALLVATRGQGAIVTPAIIDVSAITDLADEEYFGPLLQVSRYDNFTQAVESANQTRYGLAAGLISTDSQQWQYFIDHIQAGIVNRNRPLTGASGDAPFGGPGASGNLRPSAYYAADYCAYPMASIEAEQLQLPFQLAPGVSLN